MDAIKIATIPSMKLSKRQRPDEETHSATATIGSLHLTPHHLIFRSNDSPELWISLPLLHSVARAAPSFSGTNHPFILRTRDYSIYDLLFSSLEEADGVWESLKALCTSVGTNSGGLEVLYAFFYNGEEVGMTKEDRKGKGRAVNGWNVYEPTKEFSRMGVGSRSKAWRFSSINKDYEFCPSYPAEIVVPAKISDTTLNYAVKYRSKGRIPGLVYLHWANLGSITRSSQPMVGLKNARSIQDEKLIEAIFASHAQHSTQPQPTRHSFTLMNSSSSSIDSSSGGIVYGAQATNLIIDARPTTNAMANSVKGAGTENMEFYRNCKKSYLGIDNIHVMRSSLAGVYEALREADFTGQLDRVALRKTNWLKHLTNILDGILAITRTIHLSNSHVLVHCSDGWDRTSQLSSLAQLCLDPYYRTAEGLAVLIEKDWISFGHKFTDRSGHLCHDLVDFVPIPSDSQSTQAAFLASVSKTFSSSSHAFKETCPVFQQFLDCIYQIWRQFPQRFEWNEGFLRRLEWEIYSGRSGSFLFNSEKSREELNGRTKTRSVWEGIFEELAEDEEEGRFTLREEFRNERYEKELDDPDSRKLDSDQGVLMVDPQDVKWWYGLFGRTDEEMNGKPEPVVVESLSKEVVKEAQPINSVVEARENATVLNSVPSSSTTVSPLPPLPINNNSRSPSPSNSFSTQPPLNSSYLTSEQQEQFAGAVSSVSKFGWGALKSLQKGYQEAVVQYRDSSSGTSGEAGPKAYVSKSRNQLSRNGVGSTARSPSDATSFDSVSDLSSALPSSTLPSVEISTSSSTLNPWAVAEEFQPIQNEAVVANGITSSIKSISHEGQVILKEEEVGGFDPLGVGFT